MNTFIRIGLSAGLAALAALVTPAQASVIVHGTRVIYPGAQREVTVRLENTGQRPSLVQAWLDDGDHTAAPEQAAVPFNMTPPIFRLDAGKQQVLRLMQAGAALPQDRESLFWLNALEIPPRVQGEGINHLQFSFRTRIRLIYRPASLDDRAARSASDQLKWSLVDNPQGPGLALRAENPTPYYVNFARIGVRAGGRHYEHPDIGLVPPLSSEIFPLEGLNARPGNAQVEVQVVNDHGGTETRASDIAAYAP